MAPVRGKVHNHATNGWRKVSKSEESYPNAREMRAPESVQFKEKQGKFLKHKEKLGKKEK